MLWENIDDIDSDIAEGYKELQAAGIATSKHMLATEKLFFKMWFDDDTHEEIMAQFRDKGLTRSAKALFNYR